MNKLNQQPTLSEPRKLPVGRLPTAVALQAKKPVAPPAYHPQPAPKVLQTKSATAQQSTPVQAHRAPAAPPAYRPQPAPQVLQRKMAGGQKQSGASPARPMPVAPPPYRSQPTPRVLQKKASTTQPPSKNQTNRAPVAPPAYRPQPVPKVLQRKSAIGQSSKAGAAMSDARQRKVTPTAPPAYRPNPTAAVLQRNKSAAQPQTSACQHTRCGAGSNPSRHSTMPVRATARPVGRSSAIQRLIATIGYNSALENSSDPIIADQHAAVGRSLKLMVEQYKEKVVDFNALSSMDSNEPLRILGHGHHDRIMTYTAEEFAKKILELQNREKITLIELHSCSTGADENGFASKVKTIIKAAGFDKPITAPKGLLGKGAKGDSVYAHDLKVKLETAKATLLKTYDEARQDLEKSIKKKDAILSNNEKELAEEIQKIVTSLSQPKVELSKQQIEDGQRKVANLSSMIIRMKKAHEEWAAALRLGHTEKEHAAKMAYLKERDQAVATTAPMQGPALTPVEEVADQKLKQELIALGQKIAKDIKEWAEFEFSDFVSASSPNVNEDFEVDWSNLQQAPQTTTTTTTTNHLG